MHQENYDRCVEIDEIQQYLRHDCHKKTGIEALPEENTENLAMELACAIGVELVDKDISTIHRLPATKKVKDCLIKIQNSQVETREMNSIRRVRT